VLVRENDPICVVGSGRFDAADQFLPLSSGTLRQ